MSISKKGFGSIGNPFDGTAHLTRRPGADDLLGIDEYLRAEAAADVGSNDTQFVLGRDSHEGRQHEARDMGILAGGVECVAARAAVIIADCGARLDRIWNKPVVRELQARDMR